MAKWIYLAAALIFALIGWPRGLAKSWKLFLNVSVAVLIGIWCAPLADKLIAGLLPPEAESMHLFISVLFLTNLAFIDGMLICWLLNDRNRTPRNLEPQYPPWADTAGGIVFGALTGVTLVTFLCFSLTLTPLRFVWRAPWMLDLGHRAAAHLLLTSPLGSGKQETSALYLQSMIREVPMPEIIKEKIRIIRENRYQMIEEAARRAKVSWRRPEETEPAELFPEKFTSAWDGGFFIPLIEDLDESLTAQPESVESIQSKMDTGISNSFDSAPRGEFFQRIRTRQDNMVKKANAAREREL